VKQFFIVLGLFAAAQIAFASGAQNTVSPERSGNYRPKVAAHRGASGFLPEHTLEAKAMAYGLGADLLEQDVVMSKDNVLVVLHDHTLETTTDVADKFPGRARPDGHYYAIDFTLKEIKSLRVTERFDPETGRAVFPGRFPVSFNLDFTVPTLEEELFFIQGLNKSTGRDTGVYVEIKEPSFHEKEGKPIVEETIKTLTRFGYNTKGANVILQIFDYPAVKKARALGWQADIAMLVSKEEAQYLVDQDAENKIHAWLMTQEGIQELSKYATIYAPWYGYVILPAKNGKGYTLDPSIQWARKAGMKLHTWTHRSDSLPSFFASDEAFLDCLFKDVKFDGVFSDFPGNLVEYLKKNNLR
jgi:glycerophosphoryl diester phosphodiesterase